MPASLYFFIALAGLLAGYFVYGTFVEKVFGADPKRATPVCRMAAGAALPRPSFRLRSLTAASSFPLTLVSATGSIISTALTLWK